MLEVGVSGPEKLGSTFHLATCFPFSCLMAASPMSTVKIIKAPVTIGSELNVLDATRELAA